MKKLSQTKEKVKGSTMGQRHQIYVKFPAKLGIAGFHHQWLYGMTAVNSLARVLEFYRNQYENKYGPFQINTGYGLKRQSQVIQAIYSTDVKTGYWHYVHSFQDEQADYAERSPHHKYPSECEDPRLGDNNDGITIIDVSNGDFRYCFMNIAHLEGKAGDQVPKLVPISAREYLLAYYPKFLSDPNPETLLSLCEIEQHAKLLTLSECKALFPEMYKDGAK